MRVQKQTGSGQRNRCKAFVAIGDQFELGVTCIKEIATTICGDTFFKNFFAAWIRRGYWGIDIV